MNVLSFVVNIVIGLWLVPYLIKYIGIAAYGLVPLAMVFTEYISIITISINGAVTRFLTIDIQNENWKNANKIFNTAFFAMLVLILVQVPILTYVTIDVSSVFEVPDNLVEDTYYLFALTFAGYLISLLSSIFSTSMYAYNRLDLRKIVDLNRIVFRIITIIVLFTLFTPSLKFVGIANLVGAVTSIIYASIYWKKLTPKLHIQWSSFDFSILKSLTNMGGWLIINQVGFLLFLKVDIFVVNKYFGAEATGEYSAVLQWNILIRTMASVLSNVIGPMLLISFANNKLNDVIKFGKLGVKFLSIGIGICTGVVCGLSSQLLSIWLGPDFAQFSTLMIVMLCHLAINLGVLPLFPINISLNKVRVPGLVTAGMGGLNLLLALFFVDYLNYGFIGVAMAGAIVLTLKNGVFTPWYSGKILNIRTDTFYLPLLNGVALFLFAFLLTNLLGDMLVVDSWFMIAVAGMPIFIISGLLTWFAVLNKSEKEIFDSLISPKFKVLAKKLSGN